MNLINNLLSTNKCNKQFYKSYNSISLQTGCFYMGYILEDTNTNKRTAMTTLPEWGAEYSGQYINNCHLYSSVISFFESNETSIILPWEAINPKTSFQKDLILRRNELYIGANGISFCKKNNNLKEYFYFAPEINDKYFLKRISKNINLVRSEIYNLRPLFRDLLFK